MQVLAGFVYSEVSLLVWWPFSSCVFTWSSSLCIIWVQMIPLPGGSDSKESACNAGASRVLSLGRVGKIPWRTKWQPTPVFLPGKSYGQRSLEGYSPWGCKALDMTERLNNNNNNRLTVCSLATSSVVLGAIALVPSFLLITLRKVTWHTHSEHDSYMDENAQWDFWGSIFLKSLPFILP